MDKEELEIKEAEKLRDRFNAKKRQKQIARILKCYDFKFWDFPEDEEDPKDDVVEGYE
jgi:hypothetical protein